MAGMLWPGSRQIVAAAGCNARRWPEKNSEHDDELLAHQKRRTPMASEVERLRKELNALHEKRTDLQQKQAATRQRLSEIATERRKLLLRISEGDDGAQRQKRAADLAQTDLADRAEAYETALNETTAKIEVTTADLRRAER